ncbi:DUF11 domain-containing protein [Wenzhouxiangella sediminis]|uniref:DUF11 domain-containing protein n=1 Tax=Wenzhouxiangella sediminis TaxID=1792836 RepID=A0A3E1KAB2_9GAMM|nr:DUF11 domain-containing protein [Wenzhouxiangella sediminis]RFF31259.1 DUF11 domain-containing protein [Wenzhouxiangella sediminis]
MKALNALALCTAVLVASFANAGSLQSDLAVTKTDGAAASTPGTSVTYTIVVTNNGPDDVTAATVQDSFPAALSACSWTCTASAGSTCTAGPVAGNISDSVNLLNGGTATYTATCDIDPAATGTLDNTASASVPATGWLDPNTADNSATDSNTLEPSADLQITKTAGGTDHLVGEPMVYTIVATNNGPSWPSDVTVSDLFPAPLQNCSWTSTASGGATGHSNASGTLNDILDMPPGSSVTYVATCDIDPSATGTVTNTATISSAAMTDPAGGNDSATAVTGLIPILPVPTLDAWSILLMIMMMGVLGVAGLMRRFS